jgi:tetratricopeptide (TPR) repeat protein
VHGGEKDPNPPAQEAARGRYTQRLLETIDWMLQPLPQDRPQRVEDALERIASTDAPTLRDPSGPPTSSGSRARAALAQMEQERASRRQWVTTLAVGLAVVLAVAGLGVLATRRSNGPTEPAAAPAPAPLAPPAAVAPQPEAAAEAASPPDSAAAAEAAQAQQIAEALRRAEQAVAELRLTTPESDSAMFHYQQVLSLDPENATARAGVRNIVLRYVSLADSAAASGNRSQAATYLERAASISPNDPEVIAARARLAAAPPAPALRAEPPRSASPPAPRYTRFSQLKAAYRARQIDGDEYDRMVDELKRRREGELLRAKAAYVSHEITREQYGRSVREIKLRYE